jgi:tetratricopeptide (TPR) repeat protein
MSGMRGRGRVSGERYAKGVASYRSGRCKDAVELLEPVCGQDGMLGQMAGYYQAMARRALGIEALCEGRFDQAESFFRQAARVIGRNAELSGYLVTLYVRQGKYGKCADEMSRVVDCGDGDVTAWRKLAQAQWRDGRRQEARMTLAAALRKLGNLAELHVQDGLFWAAEEKFEEARQSLTSAVEADCACAEAHYYLALAAAAQGKVVDAVRSFQRAFELRRWDLVLAYQLAMAAGAAERDGCRLVLRLPDADARSEDSEVRQLAAYVAAEPEFLDACLALPDSSTDEQLFGMLAGVVQMALAAHGDYADLHYYLSRIFDRLGRLADAIEQAETAIGINPGYTRVLLYLSDLCARSNRHAEAIGHVEHAIACGADWPDVHCTAGELMLKLGMSAEARMYLQRALELNANYSRAAEALAGLAA